MLFLSQQQAQACLSTENRGGTQNEQRRVSGRGVGSEVTGPKTAQPQPSRNEGKTVGEGAQHCPWEKLSQVTEIQDSATLI